MPVGMPVGRSTLLSHRPLGGPPQTAIMRRSSTGKWYVTCSCECAEPSPLPEKVQPVGVDVGLKTLASLSTGQAMATPRFFRQEETTLAKAQRRLRKDAKGPPARAARAPRAARAARAARRTVVARVSARSTWRRSDCAHQPRRRIGNPVGRRPGEAVSVHRMVLTPWFAHGTP